MVTRIISCSSNPHCFCRSIYLNIFTSSFEKTSLILLSYKLQFSLFKWMLHQINPVLCATNTTRCLLDKKQNDLWGLFPSRPYFRPSAVTGALGPAPIWNNGTILPGVSGLVALACPASQTSITKLDSIPMTAEFKHLITCLSFTCIEHL